MRFEFKRYVKTGAKALGLNRLFWYFFKLMGDPPISSSFMEYSPDDVFGHFQDSRGHEYPLLDGLRDRLKPNWRAMFEPPAQKSQHISEATIAKGLDDWCHRISRVEHFLSFYSTTLEDKVVVEIGAYGGATSFALALAGAAGVIGTDIAEYYIQQTPGEGISTESVAAKNSELTRMRDTFRQAVGAEIGGRVSFLEDDICSSNLDSQSTDVILSWEVLEHLKHPARAFQQMFRALKPGGVAFHEYNPFFSQDGGHSLCTLDFPWGHTRLSPEDFERYLRDIRPSEEEVANRFYQENLNRMTMSDLKEHATGAGFTLLSILPWIESRHFDELTADALADSRRSFSSCEITDLISPTVWVLLRKEEPIQP